MPTGTTFFVSVVCIGLAACLILVRKKLKELKSYIKNDEKMFDEGSNSNIKSDMSFFDKEPGFLIDVDGFRSIDLRENLKGLNAFYEDEWAIIKFHLEMNDVKKFLQGSPATDRHIEIIRKKIKQRETVRIPQGFISNQKIISILEFGNAEVFSKEENRKLGYVLMGTRIEDVKDMSSCSINEYLCFPNGRVICCTSVGSLCDVHTPEDSNNQEEEKEEHMQERIEDESLSFIYNEEEAFVEKYCDGHELTGKILVKEYNRRTKREDDDNFQPPKVPIYYEEEAQLYIWERLKPQDQKRISKEIVGEIISLELDYINRTGGLTEEGFSFIQMELGEKGENCSLFDIEVIISIENGYLEKIGAIEV
jgi:hypothetical protein